MMIAMMLPSLMPMLRNYRQAVGTTGATRLGRLTTVVGAGYFLVWTIFGMAAFPLGGHQVSARHVPVERQLRVDCHQCGWGRQHVPRPLGHEEPA